MYALVLACSDVLLTCRAYSPKGRKLTREEQSKIKKHRKSVSIVCDTSVLPTHRTVQLMTYTSITVTKEAQDTYLKANPHLTPPAPVASSSSEDPTHVSPDPKTKKKRNADLDWVDDYTAPKKKKTTKL
jgi:hypothetical protein